MRVAGQNPLKVTEVGRRKDRKIKKEKSRKTKTKRGEL